MAMKLRVYELAKQHNLDNKALLAYLRDIGIAVSSHMSQLDHDEVQKALEGISQVAEKVDVDETRVKSTVIRRRVKRPKPQPEKEVPAEEAARKAEEKLEEEDVQKVSAEKPQKEVAAAPAAEQLSEEPEEQAIQAKQLPEKPEVAKREDKKPPAKAARPRRKKHEPAKILERPKIIEVHPSPPPVSPQAGPPPAAATQDLKVVPAPPKEVEAKEKTKKRKHRKSYKIIQDEFPLRLKGKGARRRDAFRLEDEAEESISVLRPLNRKVEKKAAAEAEVRRLEITTPKAIKRKIRIYETITVAELAKKMGVKAGEVVKKLMELGIMATLNQMIDIDAATLVASDFQYEVEKVVEKGEELLEAGKEEPAGELVPRSPVVTVMGHVDHGKTSLLDAVRDTRVTEQEVGGITQYIGAYKVSVDGREVVFLDTPGHEAFTSMRARGAKVTDIVVLVVAADDGVMNQTREAIDHARAAEVPILVAISKIDKPNADPEKVKKELSSLGLVPEEWGGDTLYCNVSAKTKEGIPQLLENILLQAELLELKADPKKLARGTIIEARLDRGRGPVATVLVQEGELKVNDPFVTGSFSGKVRVMTNDEGRRIQSAGPSTPVEVMGLSGVPNPGDPFFVVNQEKEARDIEQYLSDKQRRHEAGRTSRMSLEGLYRQIQSGESKPLNVVVKCDVQGSLEAVTDTLEKMSTEKVKINLIHSAVGGITENDVMLASASDAIIVGFGVRPESKAQQLAEDEGVDVRLYNVIYEMIEDIEKAMVGLLEPIKKEVIVGRGSVIQLFKISRIGTIAGTSVTDGKIVRRGNVRVIRDGKVIFEGKVDSLKHLKEDMKEVQAGYECGIHIENFNDIKVNDVIEAYRFEEITPEL